MIFTIHGQGVLYLPLIRRIGGKINGPICIWEAAQTEFVVKIRIRIHKSGTNSYFDFFACRHFFWSTVTFGPIRILGPSTPLPPACPCMGDKDGHFLYLLCISNLYKKP